MYFLNVLVMSCIFDSNDPSEPHSIPYTLHGHLDNINQRVHQDMWRAVYSKYGEGRQSTPSSSQVRGKLRPIKEVCCYHITLGSFGNIVFPYEMLSIFDNCV